MPIPTGPPRAAVRAAAALLMAATLLGVSGCASSAAVPTAPPSAGSKGLTGGKDLVNRYLDCLRDHGVPMPSELPSRGGKASDAPPPTGPQFPGGAPSRPAGVDDSTWERAKTACTGIVPGL